MSCPNLTLPIPSSKELALAKGSSEHGVGRQKLCVESQDKVLEEEPCPRDTKHSAFICCWQGHKGLPSPDTNRGTG